MKYLITPVFLFLLTIGNAQSFDTQNFNSPSGRQVFDTSNRYEKGQTIMKRSDGSLLLGITYGSGANSFLQDFEIICLNSNGTRCSNFGTNGTIDSGVNPFGTVTTIWAFAIQDNDKILCFVSRFSDRNIMRLNADGSLDTTFGTNGIMTYLLPSNALGGGVFTILPLENNNGFLLSASYSTFGPSSDHIIYKMDDNGLLDPNFGNNGILEFNFNLNSEYIRSRTIKQYDNNSFIIGLELSNVSIPQTSAYVQKYDFSGNLITSFGNNGSVIFPDAVLSSSMDFFGKR
ncbi:beta-propeller uncharacterized protein DUF5122 [Nonlabens dokdonensis]|uniref:Hemolysin-type calcium-binding region n=2 Tax=Nonlabens dokdonensis TaxID=328515 RepID=L7WBM9_NONDD|nr:hemolysin-type calcium-binding region [Nonlabens dokdonensis]AGC77514.1 hemolysin-type calcium-binding region [Nonlabens dokdonensis DSW-6]PZX39931.1 beta-propeller uncharacterized protein DUF5122 [Nonlabens dokdonensis]